MYPMAFKGKLTDRELNLRVISLFVEVFGFASRLWLHNSFSEFQWLIATLIVNFISHQEIPVSYFSY